MEELSAIEIDDFLRSQRRGRLGCHDDGLTYVVPLMFVREDDCLYFHTIEGQKVNMMRRNPSVCFEVDELWENGSWISVIALGTFEELLGDDARRALGVLGHEPPAGERDHEEPRRGQGKVPVTFRVRVLKMTGRKIVRP
jgi:nitroimidazol reductase NimA-like FMN-containing flavoprotein (pyridoxamine 5'-phosphate oxidase superfamily)